MSTTAQAINQLNRFHFSLFGFHLDNQELELIEEKLYDFIDDPREVLQMSIQELGDLLGEIL